MALSVLALFAHPDDEGFGAGGTLAMLVAGGHRVTLVCATNGDVGEISAPALATPETLAGVRQGELRTAMTVTGIEDVRFLEYRDSGMAGTEDNRHPGCLFQAEAQVVTGRIEAMIAELDPDLVITHDLTGGYGHPDHITISRHATDAVEACWESGRSRPMLYYVCFPRESFRRMWQKMFDEGLKPPFGGDDLEKMGTSDQYVTTVKNVDGYLATKKESLNCHRTQIDPDGPFTKLPVEFIDEIMSTEYFYLVQPDPAHPQPDILAGLD